MYKQGVIILYLYSSSFHWLTGHFHLSRLISLFQLVVTNWAFTWDLGEIQFFIISLLTQLAEAQEFNWPKLRKQELTRGTCYNSKKKVFGKIPPLKNLTRLESYTHSYALLAFCILHVGYLHEHARM